MSGWQELKAQKNQRSLFRLTKALPTVFREPYCPVLLPALSCRRRCGLQSSYAAVLMQFEPIG